MLCEAHTAVFDKIVSTSKYIQVLKKPTINHISIIDYGLMHDYLFIPTPSETL